MDNKKETITTAETPRDLLRPELLTVSPSPHIKAAERTGTIMFDVIIALLPAFIWGVYNFGIRALVIGLIGVASSVGFEALSRYLLRRPSTVGDLSAAVTGLLLAMNLPVTVPLWMPVVGSFFAIVVVKQLFGGIGKNFVNPALCARVFLFSWAGEMTAFPKFGERVTSLAVTLAEGDIVAGATPLAALKNGELPEVGVVDMAMGNISGCIGETSALLLLIGLVYLLARKIINLRIPVAFIGTVAVLTFLFPQGGNDNLSWMAYQLLSGGLLLGAIFMATDYVTSPITKLGQVIFGIGCGVLTVVIRYFGGYPEGVSYAILIMNCCVVLLDRIGRPKKFGAPKKEVAKG